MQVISKEVLDSGHKMLLLKVTVREMKQIDVHTSTVNNKTSNKNTKCINSEEERPNNKKNA
jgi:hypothetical protein